ncbi:hypothetical protein [Pseudomonas sp. A-R-19]|uniref:hypothetical protein n=1 Tax=Pseudomonas sp. A-R-19 TaxID=2832403 RepID=UPI001CBE9D60|nr:hypothetical protein [Pseudomonas sp. A-R-19]
MNAMFATAGYTLYILSCNSDGAACQRMQDTEAYETVEHCVTKGQFTIKFVAEQQEFQFPGQPIPKQGWECYQIPRKTGDKPVEAGGYKLKLKKTN